MRTFTLSLLLAFTIATPAIAAEPAQAMPQDYAGHYAMQDGRILQVSTDGDTLAVEISPKNAFPNSGNRTAKTVFLKPLGQGRFASATTPMLVTFSADARGAIVQASVSDLAVPAQAMASR